MFPPERTGGFGWIWYDGVWASKHDPKNHTNSAADGEFCWMIMTRHVLCLEAMAGRKWGIEGEGLNAPPIIKSMDSWKIEKGDSFSKESFVHFTVLWSGPCALHPLHAPRHSWTVPAFRPVMSKASSFRSCPASFSSHCMPPWRRQNKGRMVVGADGQKSFPWAAQDGPSKA